MSCDSYALPGAAEAMRPIPQLTRSCRGRSGSAAFGLAWMHAARADGRWLACSSVSVKIAWLRDERSFINVAAVVRWSEPRCNRCTHAHELAADGGCDQRRAHTPQQSCVRACVRLKRSGMSVARSVHSGRRFSSARPAEYNTCKQPMSDSNDGHSVSSTPWMQIPPFGSSRIVCNSAKETQSAGPKPKCCEQP